VATPSVHRPDPPVSTTGEHMFAKLFLARSVTVTPPVANWLRPLCAPGGAHDHSV
jgi:hypothetical protein